MNLLHAIITITSQLRSVLALHQPNKTTTKRQQKDNKKTTKRPAAAICHLPFAICHSTQHETLHMSINIYNHIIILYYYELYDLFIYYDAYYVIFIIYNIYITAKMDDWD